MQYEVRWQGRDVLLTCTCPGCGSIYATAAARGLPRPLRHAILKHIPEALSPGRPGWHRLDVAYLRREVAGFEHALAELFRFCLTCRGYRCPRCFEAEAPGCSVCAPAVHSMQEPVLVRLDKQAAPVEIVVEQPTRGRARDEELEEQVWGHALRRERAAASRRGGTGVESGAGRRGSTGRTPGRGLPGRATVPLLTVGDASFLRPSAVVAVVSLQMDQPEAGEPIRPERAGQGLGRPVPQDHGGPEAPASRPFIVGNGRRAAPPDAGGMAGLERGPWREPAPAGPGWQPGPPEPAPAGESAPEDEPARPRPPVIARSLAGRGSAPGETGGRTTVWRGLLAAGALVAAGAGWLVDTLVGKRTSTAGQPAGMAAQGQARRGAPEAVETVAAAEGTAAEPPQRPRRAQCSGCRLYYPDTFRYCPRCNILLLR